MLTRSDLADPGLTQAWLEHFRSQPNVAAFMSTTDRPQDTRRQISELTRGMALHRGPTKRVRALITGVPNVGKSTLLNILMNRNVALVGDKPAITKQQQAVILKDGTTLTDSPGLLWPKIVTKTMRFGWRSPARSRTPRSITSRSPCSARDSCSSATRRCSRRATS